MIKLSKKFLFMTGHKVERRGNKRMKFTWKMLKVVPNLVCKLLDGDPLIIWRQGWRKKRSRQWQQEGNQWETLSQNRAFSVKEPCTMPWFNNIPVCFNYSIPCPEFRTELEDIPQEMSTAHAFLHFEDIHEVLNRSIVNLWWQWIRGSASDVT